MNAPLESPAPCPAFDAFVVELEVPADPVMVEVPELSAEVVVAGAEAVAIAEVGL